MNKKISRLHRSVKTRKKLKRLFSIRLVIHKTSKHIYAQIISADNSKILLSSSTLEKNIYKKLKYTGNKYAANLVGQIIAIKALNQGIKKVSFDRSGFKYHGRVKALADAARKKGLDF